MTNIEKMNEMLTKDPELQKTVNDEMTRISETMEKKDPKAIFAQASKTVLDIDFTEAELEQIFPKTGELSPDEIGNVNAAGVAGAVFGGFVGSMVGGVAGSALGPVGTAVAAAVGLGLGAYLGHLGQEENKVH